MLMSRVDPFLEVMGIPALWQRRDGVWDVPALAMPVGEAAEGHPDVLREVRHDVHDDVRQDARQDVSAEAEPTMDVAGELATEMVAELTVEATIPLVQAESDFAREVNVPSVAEPATDVLDPVTLLDFDALRERVTGCTGCRLCETRTNAVFGVGNPHADWMIIGEAPGANEDQQGEPFVGQAGKLLDNMLRALGLDRGLSGVFIANVIKCRPPGNRDPQPDEVAACERYLKRQIALVQPRIIVALGRFAAQTVLRTDARIGSLRGQVHAYEGVPVVVTYHPAYLLRTLTDKAKAWEDLCLARATYQALPDSRVATTSP
jgi:DNA polymerase